MTLVNVLFITTMAIILTLVTLSVVEVLYYGIIGSGSSANTESSAMSSLVLTAILILLAIARLIVFGIQMYIAY